MKLMTLKQCLLCTASALTLFGALPAAAQVPGIVGKPLLKVPLSGDDTKATTILSVEFAPGAVLPRHTHPGDEYATLLEGTLELHVAGQEPRRVSAGQAYHNPRGQIHETRNVGDGFARVVITFVLSKDQPLSTPAPAP